MRTNKLLLLKSIRYFSITLLLMFTGPVILYQAFKNEGHPFYWPVLIVALIVCIGAIMMGFYSVKTVIKALFGDKKSRV